jgi:hypothetical protein
MFEMNDEHYALLRQKARDYDRLLESYMLLVRQIQACRRVDLPAIHHSTASSMTQLIAY